MVDKRVREMFGQSDTEKNISFSKCATAAPRLAPPRPAAPRRHYCSAPAALECSLSWEAQHLDWRTHAHARTCTQRERERERGRGGREKEGDGALSKQGGGREGESAAEFVPHHPCPLRLLQVRGHPEAELQSEGR